MDQILQELVRRLCDAAVDRRRAVLRRLLNSGEHQRRAGRRQSVPWHCVVRRRHRYRNLLVLPGEQQ